MIILHVPASPDRYPLALADFRREHPSLAVGDAPTDAELQPYGWRVVAPTDPPIPGPDQRAEQASRPELVDGTYRQAWVLVDVEPPPPDPDWDTFVAWLYLFPPIATGMDAARLSTNPQGEPATTGLPATLDEARLRQGYPAFARAWGLFLLASGMAPEALGAIVAKASECNLPPEFVAALQPVPPP